MSAADVGGLVERLFFSAPLLYVGLVMTIDTAGFERLLQDLSTVLRTFQYRLQGSDWRSRLEVRRSAMEKLRPQRAIRWTGCVIAAFAFLHIVGVWS
jgi:hypothetical protein